MRARGQAACLAGALLLVACNGSVPQDSGPIHFPGYRVRGRQAQLPQLRYFIEANEFDAQGALRGALRRAHAAWESTRVVRFVEAQERAQADVTYGWRRRSHDGCKAFGQDHGIAHTGPVEVPTFVHFDLGQNWRELQGDGHSLHQAAVHEIGHVLGLDHSLDERSVMFSATNPDRTALAADDRAAIASLYGGGQASPADLVLAEQGTERELLMLRRVAPRGVTDFAVFDTDGDEQAELLIWRTDASGSGVLMIYHFGPGPVLMRTIGPIYGQTIPGSAVHLVQTSAGERLLVSELADGRYLARRFDDDGLLEIRPAEPLSLYGATDRAGDGAWDEGPPAFSSAPRAGILGGVQCSVRRPAL